MLWHRDQNEGVAALELEQPDYGCSEQWSVKQMLQSADTKDIYDLDFSPDGRFLIVGLTDNSAQIWDLGLSKLAKVLRDHKHFVQGVAWDPFNQVVVTQSSDRYTHTPHILHGSSSFSCPVEV